RGPGSGQISATVSARSPTKSKDQPNSSGSTRVVARPRTWAGFASAKDNSPVSAASAQPRSGSGVVAKYSCIRRSLPLRDGVNTRLSSSGAKRSTLFLVFEADQRQRPGAIAHDAGLAQERFLG